MGFFDPVRTKLLAKRGIEVINVQQSTDRLASGLEEFMPELLKRAEIA